MSDAKTFVVVSHTHWDREWYQPFETFRGRLVRMMDSLIELLQTDPEFKHFVLDGQSDEQAARQLLGAKQPSQAFVTVEQVAALAGFLASEQAAQVRGAHWNMDGGFAAA